MESRNRVERCLDLFYATQWDPFFSWVCVVGGGLMFGVGFFLGVFAFSSMETDFGLLANSVFMAVFSFQGAASLVHESRRTLVTMLRLLSVVAMIAVIALWTLEGYSLFGFYIASIFFIAFATFFASGMFYRCRRAQRE